jgi:hypothetical protein
MVNKLLIMEHQQHRLTSHDGLKDSLTHKIGRWFKKTSSTGIKAWLGSMKSTKTILKESWV